MEQVYRLTLFYAAYIVSQTNLLSMNTAIMTIYADKDFAVIVDEIRKITEI